MQRLLIQFVDDQLGDFRWTTYDESTDSGELGWQAAVEAELEAVASKNPYPVIIVIPQQCVYLTEIELPEKASRQVLSAIEYQVEDQLAQDIESQHFALGDTSVNPIAIAVVSKTIMERCLSLAQTHGLRLVQVIPELFLCPWQGDGVALTGGHDGYLLRYGKYSGFKSHAQAMPTMLGLVGRDFSVDRIRFYAGDDQPTPAFDGFEIERYALAETRPGFSDAPLIDLQQRDYQLSSVWKGLARAWKWIALLFVTLLAIGAYNRAVALHELETELAGIKLQQYDLLKPYLPENTSVDGNLKKILIERLDEMRSSQRERGFLRLMLEFTRAKSRYPDIGVSRISFQGKRLSFDISSNKLNDIESLLDSVKKLGVTARLENLNIKPEQSSGRLILEGGGNA